MAPLWLWATLLSLFTPLAPAGPPGPKSRDFPMLRFDPQEWLDHQDSSFFLDLWDVGGEGRATAMSCFGREDRVFSSFATPKAHGQGPVESHGTQTRPPRPTVKRSFARAMRRLQKTGFCIYRGNVHVRPPDEPPMHYAPKLQQNRAPRTKGPRLSCITWNCGGLSSAGYNELLVWLSIHQLDVCFVQGTRWPFDEPWESHGFALIPTPHQVGGHDGLLTIIRTQLCPTSAISHVTVLAGRIQHVRCHLSQVTLSIVISAPISLLVTDLTPLRLDPNFGKHGRTS